MPIGISLEGGDHKDLLRKEAVPLRMPRGVPIGILLESLLRDGVGAHKNLLREGRNGGHRDFLREQGVPPRSLDPLDPSIPS